MKRKKLRLLSALLVLALFVTALPQSAAAASFTDVPDNAWYKDYVYDLVGQGIIHGTSETTFSPDGKLSRAQLVTMMAQSALSAEDLKQYTFQGDFKDVTTSHWAYRYINWAYEAGIVSGVGNSLFKPDSPVSRQDMAVMLVNFSKATGRQMTAIRDAVSFTDSGKIAGYAANSVRICQRAGVLSGDTEGTFRPKSTASRAEAATMYSNFLKRCNFHPDYKITRKRILGTAVRAVEFSGSTYSPQLVLGHDRVTGSESAASVVERTGAKIAVNAAFFDLDSYVPLGTLIKDGRVVTVFDQYAPARSALVVDSAGKLSIRNFSTSHTVTLHKDDGTDSVLNNVTVNRWPSSATDATRILYTRDWGTSLGFPARDAVILDENGLVTYVTHYADAEIPEHGYVLAQRSRRTYEGDFFDSCKVGTVLDIERRFEGDNTEDMMISIGAGPRLVKDGVVYGGIDTYRAEGYTDPNITTYSAVRMCLGIKADGSIVIVSSYTTLQQLSKVMVSLGCTDAINLDGGGSANLYVNGYWLRGPQGRPLNTILIFK